jgi:hypothetical protein
VNDSADAFEFFFDKPWSDGLPVVPPTEARVARMLEGARRDPEAIVGHVPPLYEAATVRAVAMHAVMAGCQPAYLPVVLGGIETMLIDEFCMNGVQATMHSVAPLMIVNGPYGKQIGLHGGTGCFGPGFRANATIGRAIRLVLLNLGGGIPGITSMSAFGQPSRYTYCIRENEEESPWEPLSVTHGHEAEANVVTCIMCENPKLVFDDVSAKPDSLLYTIADTMALIGSRNVLTGGDMLVAIGPEHARLCAKAGMSKADVHERLRELACLRLGDVKRGAWRPEFAERWPVAVDLDDDNCMIPAVLDPERFQMIVAGGTPGPISAVMHGWNPASRSVNRAYDV